MIEPKATMLMDAHKSRRKSEEANAVKIMVEVYYKTIYNKIKQRLNYYFKKCLIKY